MAFSIANSGSTNATNTATPSLSITTPTSGNLLVAFIASRASSTSVEINAPSGWELLRRGGGSTLAQRACAAYKVADGTETAIAFGVTGTSNTDSCVVYVEIAGFSGTPTLDASDFTNSSDTSVTSISAGTATASNAGIAVALCGAYLGSSWFNGTSWTNSFVERVSGTNNNQGPSCEISTLEYGTTGSKTTTWSTTDGGDEAFGVIALFYDDIGADSITLTDVDGYKVIPRNGSGQGSLTISGTYSGSPTAIQYKIVENGTSTAISGHDWSTLDDSPSGGAFSGTVLAIPEGGWYNVQVRYSNDTGVTDEGSNKWGVGYHIVIGGQSHAEDMRTDGTGTASDLLSKYNGGWSAHGTTGAGDIALGNAVIAALGGGIPVAIFNGAVGGSALSQEADGGSGYWEAGAASLYDTWTVSVDAMGGAPHFGIFWQGDRDAISGVVTEAEYETRLAAAISQYRTDYGASLPVIIGLLNRDDAAVDADWQAIRNAQLDVAVADSDTYYFSVVDLTTEVDGQHLADASLVTAGQRIANIINYLNGDASYWRGPYISGFTKNSNTTGTVTITHVGGSDFTPTGASAITGFEVSDDQSTWESATASRASATTIDLSWSTSFSGAVYVRYMYGGDPSETGAVVDNATVALPLEYLGRDYVAGGGGVSQELTGNSSTSAVGTLGVSAEASVSVTPTGVASSSAVGTLGVTAEINASAELSGVAATSAVGTLTAEVGGGTTVALSGAVGTAAVGALTAAGQINEFVDLLGNSATGAVGTLIVVTGLQVALSGNAATGAVGTLGVTAEVNASATLTGVGSSGAVGTLEVTVPITASVELTGASATGAIGSLTAVGAGQVWTEIPPVSTTWTEIS